ncbi:MAG TPA: DUF523 domain-containing protein [Thermoanaerobaculia bacterium]|nr:DUF523 domain-containing protein [Thermoanaerobaculia bacterium]
MLKILVSSCLLGAAVRHDGRDKKSHHPALQRWMDEGRVVSVCPEMLGGLGTPRPPSEIVNDGSRRVISNEGRDVTREFEAGARAVTEQVSEQQVRVAILKAGSPSCGSSLIYDGTFSKTAIPGEGITTAALRKMGVRVFSEAEIDAAEAYVAELENLALSS